MGSTSAHTGANLDPKMMESSSSSPGPDSLFSLRSRALVHAPGRQPWLVLASAYRPGLKSAQCTSPEEQTTDAESTAELEAWRCPRQAV